MRGFIVPPSLQGSVPGNLERERREQGEGSIGGALQWSPMEPCGALWLPLPSRSLISPLYLIAARDSALWSIALG